MIDSALATGSRRKTYLEDGPASTGSHTRPQQDFALVIVDDALRKAKPEPIAVRFLRRKERLKQLVDVHFLDAASIVGYDDIDMVLVSA